MATSTRTVDGYYYYELTIYLVLPRDAAFTRILCMTEDANYHSMFQVNPGPLSP